MWLLAVDEIAADSPLRAPDYGEETVLLLGLSSEVYAVGSGRELLLTFGMFSTSLLSERVCVWLQWVNRRDLTLAELRMIKKVMGWIFTHHDKQVFAETLQSVPENGRFVEFLGFVPVAEGCGNTLYEWRN